MTSQVFFTDFRAKPGTSVPEKLTRLLRRAGLPGMDLDGKFVAIKMHFGEPGNLSFLRPNYAKVVADLVKECGGVPFLTDCNTLYPGRRKTRWSTLRPPMRTASPPSPPAARSSSATA